MNSAERTEHRRKARTWRSPGAQGTACKSVASARFCTVLSANNSVKLMRDLAPEKAMHDRRTDIASPNLRVTTHAGSRIAKCDEARPSPARIIICGVVITTPCSARYGGSHGAQGTTWNEHRRNKSPTPRPNCGRGNGACYCTRKIEGEYTFNVFGTLSTARRIRRGATPPAPLPPPHDSTRPILQRTRSGQAVFCSGQ